MSVELAGTVRMNGEADRETRVRIQVEGEILRLKSGEDVLGEWSIHEIGIHALNEGFLVRAEGEEFLLVTEDDAALAESLDLKTVSPRLAKQVLARRRPEEAPSRPELEPEPSRVGAIAFALSGALVVVGATFLRAATLSRGQDEVVGRLEFWLAFTIGGVLMIATGVVLARPTRWGRLAAILSLALIMILFGLAVSDTRIDATHLTAYGFLAGGLVVGVAVLFGGLLEDRN